MQGSKWTSWCWQPGKPSCESHGEGVIGRRKGERDRMSWEGVVAVGARQRQVGVGRRHTWPCWPVLQSKIVTGLPQSYDSHSSALRVSGHSLLPMVAYGVWSTFVILLWVCNHSNYCSHTFSMLHKVYHSYFYKHRNGDTLSQQVEKTVSAHFFHLQFWKFQMVNYLVPGNSQWEGFIKVLSGEGRGGRRD